MNKKLLAIFLIVAMLFSCVPIAAMAEEEENNPLWLETTIVLFENNVYSADESAENGIGNLIDGEYLEEIGITTGSSCIYTFENMNIASYVETVLEVRDDDATIILNGENSIQGYSDSEYGMKIRNLMIQGTDNDSLTVDMSLPRPEPMLLSVEELETPSANGSVAIEGNLSVEGGSVTAIGSKTGLYFGGSNDMVISGGIVKAIGDSYGAQVNSHITITGGDVTFSGGEVGLGGHSKITGGNVIMEGNSYACGEGMAQGDAPETTNMSVYASSDYDGAGKTKLTNWVGDGSDDVSAYKYLELIPKSGGTNTGGSSGFNGEYNYPIIVLPVAGADVETSKDFAKAGESITITADLAKGRQVDTVVVTDEDDNELTVTEVSPVEYTFVMPASEATVAMTTTYDSDAAKQPVKIIMQIGNYEILVNGETIQHDVPPTLVNDRTMLPIAIVAEALGTDVDWDADARKVTITKDDIVIELFIDEYYAYFNGEKKILDAAPYIEDNRTYLPVRFVSEHLGADVYWDGVTRTVTIIAE